MSSEQQLALGYDGIYDYPDNYSDNPGNDDRAFLTVNSDELEDGDYTVLQVKIDNKVYTVYYLFPGDNSAGLFKLDEETWYDFGEGWDGDEQLINPVFMKFLEWYRDITENEVDYGMFHYRCDNGTRIIWDALAKSDNQ